MKGSRPTVKVWCLPKDTGEEDLKKLFQAILQTLINSKELGVTDQNDVIILFPADMMEWGLGTDIRVEVEGLPTEPPQMATLALDSLAERIGKTVRSPFFPTASVDCRVGSPYNNKGGFWTTRE